MSDFSAFFDNSVFFWSLLSCLITQLFKIIFNFFSTGKFRPEIMFETGGMPSSHSALITGATSGLGLELGFDSSIFALARTLDPKSELDLKETLGHTKIQVLVGSFLGPLITLPGIVFVGSPMSIFNFIVN